MPNHLRGLTRALAQAIVNILFCKIYDEINTGMDDVVTFRSGVSESPRDVKERTMASTHLYCGETP